MLFFKKKTPYEKEMAAILKKERRFLQSRKDRKESFVNQKLEQFVPKKLQSGIDSAFAKAFGLIFEKGTKVIEKTYNRKNLEIDFYEKQYMNAVLENKRTLRAFSKKAKASGVGRRRQCAIPYLRVGFSITPAKRMEPSGPVMANIKGRSAVK